MGGERIHRNQISKVLISISMSAVFMLSLLAGMAAGRQGDEPVGIADEETRQIAKWSALVYLVADNNLDEYTETDLLELEVGGSSEDVNVLILMDKLNEPAYLYMIDGHERVLLESLGELNMGDPKNLEWFVEYSDEYYPAEHMLLYFWDHGTPTGGVGVDTTLPGSEPGSDWDWLSHHEMMDALEGHHVDVIACDECSIGQMETLYEYAVKGLDVEYMVASESYIGWRGFSYDDIHQALVADPDMDALALSEVIVGEFTDLFSVAPFKSEILTTQSIFDMSEIIPLGDAVTALALALTEDMDSWRATIKEAQLEAIMPWGARLESWIDMPTFVGYIMDNAKKGSAVMKACEDVFDAYSLAMLGMGITKNSEMYGYQGMGILFPASHSSYTVAYADSEWGGYNIYITYEFPNMGWWDFLEAFWGMT